MTDLPRELPENMAAFLENLDTDQEPSNLKSPLIPTTSWNVLFGSSSLAEGERFIGLRLETILNLYPYVMKIQF
jgi:hypothetical protein